MRTRFHMSMIAVGTRDDLTRLGICGMLLGLAGSAMGDTNGVPGVTLAEGDRLVGAYQQ